jgi:hypothetical protein
VYSSTLSLTSALGGSGWSTLLRGHFTPRNGTRYCILYRRLSGPQVRSGRVRKLLPSPELDPQTVQPVASRCTDYTVLVHKGTLNLPKIRYPGH